MGSEDTWRKPIISSDLSMFDCMVDKMSFPVRERVVSEMFPSSFSNSTSMSEEASGSSVLNPMFPSSSPHQEKIKKRRNHPGNPAPDSEVIALSPKTLMATNRFICEVCHKGFQRDQNLQLHRRGHSLPWKLKQRDPKDFKKKVYVCPEPTCIHHNPSRALGDLTGIKKHFSRKHGEKKWKCEKCSKCYAVLSDHKAHIKTCGTKEYKCDCGTIFSRKDSFTTHRAFCEALAEESAKLTTTTTNPLLQTTPTNPSLHLNHQNPNLTHLFSFPSNTTQLPRKPSFPSWNPPPPQNPNPSSNNTLPMMKPQFHHNHNHNQIPTISSSPLLTSLFHQNPNMTNNYHVNNNNTNTSHQLLSATAMLQAANVAAAPLPFGGTTTPSQSVGHHMTSSSSSLTQLEMAAGLNAFGNSVSHHHQIGNNRMPSQQQQQQQQQEEYMGLNAENLATWQESGHATRDFLGLAGGDCSTNAGNVNVSNLFSFAGTVDLPSYNRVQSLLKSRGFRY